MNFKKNNIIIYLKIFVYGIITPSIISFAFYYTFSTAIKIAIKEALIETFDKSLKKNLELFLLKKIKN